MIVRCEEGEMVMHRHPASEPFLQGADGRKVILSSDLNNQVQEGLKKPEMLKLLFGE